MSYRSLFSRCVIVITVVAAGLCSCNRLKQKTKEGIHESGKAVGKGSSEFVNGIAEGIDQTFECRIEIANSLTVKGIKSGKFKIASNDTTNNLLSVYLIFEKDFKDVLSTKVFDKNGQEYGRTNIAVEAKSGEAKYVDFTFDKRTAIESKSKFVIE